ncbi:MAG TPA: hypothetical protein VFA78_05260 [Chloroflexota bacterium]|nr:hypothetical protein [Chloroflexota bacterium]
MELAEFPTPALAEDDRIDLGVMLTGLSGVAGIDFYDHVLRVEFDPKFTDEEVIKAAIVGSGYPVPGSAH